MEASVKSQRDFLLLTFPPRFAAAAACINLVRLISPFESLAPVVQTLDSAIHWINHYPLDNSIGFASVYLLDGDLSGGQRYPSFEQLGPGSVVTGYS